MSRAQISAIVSEIRNISIGVSAGAAVVAQATGVPHVVTAIALAVALIAHTVTASIDAYDAAEQSTQ